MKSTSLVLLAVLSLSFIACGKHKKEEQNLNVTPPANQYYCTMERIISINGCFAYGWCNVQLTNGIMTRAQFPQIGQPMQYCPNQYRNTGV